MKFSECHKYFHRISKLIVAVSVAFGCVSPVFSSEAVIRYFPSGTIYEYRWKLLELALAHTNDMAKPLQLVPFTENVTQNRGISLLEAGDIDVIALGTNAEREAQLLPIKIDILRGIVGFRLLVIRAADQERITQMDDISLRKQLMFGLNSQWADLPIMRANGFSVVTSSDYENLFVMLAANRFDAFPRGLNEARRELDERKQNYPQLAIEKSKALYFPYPVYFWVNKNNVALAKRIELGLNRSLADGSFRKLFESYHAAEITALKKEKRKVILLDNTILPAGNAKPDTSWWWPKSKY
ncbi:transporter substrate-binding domain-containing protein [uncultured Tolumonas sp.]|uniref:substrate-binding periplasmic protein n=1 Tax=uncultured Tolumonas sp. TaxID=263765 RepID=UPI00293182D8|nr:transporter substrate-binding domain-containing protein [uncultured Tolumonas sp.]